MPLSKKILSYLHSHKVPHEVRTHKVVYTAFDTAMTLGVPLAVIVKPLLIKKGSSFVLALLPADRKCHFVKLAKLLGARVVSLPSERSVLSFLKAKKKGALHAFGSFYKIPVVFDAALMKRREVFLPAASFTDSLLMKPRAYCDLERPFLGSFAVLKK